MSWGAVIAGGAALIGGVMSSKKSSKVADEAAEREGAASTEAIERQEAAYEEAKGALAPYARQEAAASSQMMAQMGIAPVQGGAQDPWGYQEGGYTGGGGGARDTGAESMTRFMEDLIANEMAIARQAGYKGKHGIKAVSEGARRAQGIIRDLKAQGKLPADFKEPSMAEWNEIGQTQMQAHGGYKALGRNINPIDPATIADRSYPGGQLPGAVQAGGPGGMMGQGEMIDPETGQVTGGGGQMGGGPQVQTIQSIMERAGAEGLPEGFSDQYFEDMMRDPMKDPELAGYLGLTEESLRVGADYQNTPAYAAAREAGVEAVDASAAAGGGLYSGRRGKALRDVGQDVEQQYYMDAMNRRESMVGARRGERGAGLARRGATYQAGQQREQSYYNNYMSMLSELSAPTTTTNIAAMGTSLGKETSANIMGTARGISDLEIGAAGAEQAAIADAAKGISTAASYI